MSKLSKNIDKRQYISINYIKLRQIQTQIIMKKLMLLLAIGVLFANCQQEEVTETSADLTTKAADTDYDAVPNKYFGVLSTFDTQIHGELRINLEADTEFQAIVTLVNEDVLKFKAIVNRTNPAIVDFKGSAGTFTIDFSDKGNIVGSNFLVDNKQGYIGVYPEPRSGGGIVFGTYVDSLDPTFSGNWDMFNFTMLDPITSFPVIEDIMISHTGGLFFNDETPGIFEPFIDTCFFTGPAVGAQTDGVVFSGLNQIATFNGVTTSWSMYSIFGTAIDPNTCLSLPPGTPQGTWSRGSRSGTLTQL